MLDLMLAALITVAQAPAGAPTPTPAVKPAYDVFGTALAARTQIREDKRCGEAADATDAFVKSRGSDVESGLRAMLLLEKCATLDRVQPQTMAAITDWNEYTDYVNTAAAAIAYQIGFATGEPRAYVRAATDAARVRGYEAPQSVTQITYAQTPTAGVINDPMGFGEQSVYSQAASGLREIYAGIPMANSGRYRTQTHHMSGYAGPYGAQATAIANASVDALQAIVREARPQSTPPPK